LHGCLENQQASGWEAIRGGRDDIMFGCRLNSSENTDAVGNAGKRALALGVEEPLICELGSQSLEPSQDISEPDGLNCDRTQLKRSSSFVQVGTPKCVYASTFCQWHGEVVVG
jgi:hypothetical protein